jgi:hypothetical protein
MTPMQYPYHPFQPVYPTFYQPASQPSPLVSLQPISYEPQQTPQQTQNSTAIGSRKRKAVSEAEKAVNVSEKTGKIILTPDQLVQMVDMCLENRESYEVSVKHEWWQQRTVEYDTLIGKPYKNVRYRMNAMVKTRRNERKLETGKEERIGTLQRSLDDWIEFIDDLSQQKEEQHDKFKKELDTLMMLGRERQEQWVQHLSARKRRISQSDSELSSEEEAEKTAEEGDFQEIELFDESGGGNRSRESRRAASSSVSRGRSGRRGGGKTQQNKTSQGLAKKQKKEDPIIRICSAIESYVNAQIATHATGTRLRILEHRQDQIEDKLERGFSSIQAMLAEALKKIKKREDSQ